MDVRIKGIKEQIWELAEQAGGFPCSQDEWGFYNKDLEKFAELIVKERLAAWMMRQGFATGHGDTTEELLEELSWQVAEIKAQRDELLAALREIANMAYDYLNKVKSEKGLNEAARAALAKAKGE